VAKKQKPGHLVDLKELVGPKTYNSLCMTSNTIMSSGDPFIYYIDNQKIDRVQRRATRMMPSISQLPYQGRLKHLNLPSLQYQGQRCDLIYLYQILKGDYDSRDNHLFIPSTSNTRGHSGGHPMKLFKYHTNSLTRSNFSL